MEVFVLMLAAGIVFGVWSARVLAGKGRSRELGFVLGFFHGLIGLIIAWVMPASDQHNRVR